MKRPACLLSLLLALSCGVHEWPENSSGDGQVCLSLSFETELPQWTPDPEGRSGAGAARPVPRDLPRTGQVRHVVRAFPIINDRVAQVPSDEFVFTADLADGHDGTFTLGLLPGSYRLMVWSDLAEGAGRTPFYNADNFLEVSLADGPHAGSTDYRDAFRGWADVTVESYRDGGVHAPVVVPVTMQRPLAKFEFVATDLAAFVERETRRAAARQAAPYDDATPVKPEDYRVVFYYQGFMPSAYSLFIDRPVDSATAVQFDSALRPFSEGEASLGFDYVFVKEEGEESAVTLRIALFDAGSGERLSLSGDIRVPLRRGRHTVIRDEFLLKDASGGVGVDPGYDGDLNIHVPF